MKPFLILIISLFFTNSAFTQQVPLDSGFTNKAEAKNLLVHGKKEGKWIEYTNIEADQSFTTDSNGAINYHLTIYKHGIPVGIQWGYYMNGKLWSKTPWTNSKINGIVTEYYKNGKLKRESSYNMGM